MGSQDSVSVVSRIWEEVWNEGDLSACDEIFAPDYTGVIPAQG
jgi:hypothetical protein